MMQDFPPICYERLSESNFPQYFWTQTGEAFGRKIDWNLPQLNSLVWDPSCNLDMEPGINLSLPGWGYAGFIPSEGIYTRYKNLLKQGQPYGEHVLRIFTEEPILLN